VRFVSSPATKSEAVLDEYAQILRQSQARWDRIERTLTTLAGAAGGAARAGSSLKGCSAEALPSERALRQEISQILREELWNVLTAAGAGTDGARAKELAAAKILNTPENIEAYAQAHELVRAALSSGYWTDENVQELRQSLAYLTDEQREEILRILIPAINRGEVAVETSGPPL
jgi:hypothetical protein